MNKQSFPIQVSASIGTVTGEYITGKKSKCVMTLAHGAGAGMNHDFMITLAEALAEKGITTLRFNFPFTEQKKKRPDVPAVAHKTVEAAIIQAGKDFPNLPLFASGKSFGGRMTSQYLSANYDTKVKGIVFYGFPLHPAGKPSVDRAEHLQQVQVPMLFLQGTKDELATWDLIESVCAPHPLAELVKIEGANHAFKAGKLNTIELLTRATSDWIDQILG